MSTPAPKGSKAATKRRRGDEISSARKRTRTLPHAQDQAGGEVICLRGGRGSFSPAAGTWEKPTDEDPNQNRLFSNLGRVPVNAGLGIPAPTPPPTQSPASVGVARQTPTRQERAPTGTKTGPGGPTPEDSSEERGGRDDNARRGDQGATPTPARRLSVIEEIPSPGPTPETDTGAMMDDSDVGGGASPNHPGPESNWEYPNPRWNTDRQIIDAWKALEVLVAKYVDDIIVDSIPDIDTTHYVYPYEVFARLSDLAIPMVRNEKYAKYIFQLSLWNLLSEKFLSHMATEWACEEKGRPIWGLRTKGLAAAMGLLTYGHSMDPRTKIPKQEREKWYLWRKDTVDVAYGWLSKHTDYEQTVDNAIFDILTLYQGHIQPEFAGGDRQSWDNLVGRTTELVTFAARLSIMMRRSRDGTWSPFIPIRGQIVRPEAMMRHQDTAVSLPPGQTGIRVDSIVTVTVVPGLSKYEMTDVDDDPAHPGEKITAIRKRVRMKAKCIIDITEEHTGERRDGDLWIADDI
ncbi:hypothetical protein N0V93_004134 [Gnomoniopsis smithogilvyi]|uniref:Uncharacterized protein n=1 Tax=Gnomoniopsis smithogilvyi TaxID=1191159 RepID=A0A9W8YRU2_9PEZI|nr:hypothetical protein N0V93_004134 [Gnomoniopsis smithogilvyi]